MSYEQKPNTGSLFKNERKESDTHADYRGSITITEPGEYWLDAWINEAASGKKYMGLKAKLKDAQGTPQREPAAVGDLDDDVPF